MSTSSGPILPTISYTSIIHSTPHGSTKTSLLAKQTASNLSAQLIQQTTKSTLYLNPSVTIKNVTNPPASVATTSTSSYMVAPPTPGQIMKPPLTLSTLNQCGMGGCCTHALSQLPGLLVFDESETAGRWFSIKDRYILI